MDIDICVAIVGISLRFPDANNVSTYWKNLLSGRESITRIESRESQEHDTFGKTYVPFTSHIENIDKFDERLFGYSAQELREMDPQHRIFLECAWEVFEDAGYNPGIFNGRIGVFAGCGVNTYFINNVLKEAETPVHTNLLDRLKSLQLILANEKDFLATRVSHKLNLTGPSVNVQSACSTSLVALHLACQSLIVGDCEMAIAGASTVKIPQLAGHYAEEGMVMSRDGHTRPFDNNASGTVFGSGVACVLLKSLRNAIEDKDDVYAVIRGTAINNDGALKAGFTTPSVAGQSEVIAQAINNAGISAESITYVEAHGTATRLGDPIEIQALKRAFNTDKRRVCAIGSVKGNFGHLSWTSGMAGLIKAVLSLKERTLLPTINFEVANSEINFDETPFYVNTTVAPWVSRHNPLRAGVSAFGLGGTNAHVILEEAPATDFEKSDFACLLTLSANSRNALVNLISNYLSEICRISDSYNISDICFTSNLGRAHLEKRCAIIANSHEELEKNLKKEKKRLEEERIDQAVEPMQFDKAVAFLFSGQGSLYLGCASFLYRNISIFKAEMDHFDELIFPHLGLPMSELLSPELSNSELLNDLRYSGAMLFAIQYSIAKMWMKLGVRPSVVAGHSAGEYAAAAIANVFSKYDAFQLCLTRGRLLYEKVGNESSMISISASEHEVTEIVEVYGGKLAISAINGPLSVVLAGEYEAINHLIKDLNQKNIKHKKLDVNIGAHSGEIDQIIPEFSKIVSKIKMSSPEIPFVSGVSGKLSREEISTSEYWCRQMRAPVRFSEVMNTLSESDMKIFVEIGPDSVLLGMGAFCLPSLDNIWLPTLRKIDFLAKKNGRFIPSFFKSLGKLYEMGFDINWQQLHEGRKARRAHLPTYPFQRRSFWCGNDTNINSHNSGINSYIKAHWEFYDGNEKTVLYKEKKLLIISDSADGWADDRTGLSSCDYKSKIFLTIKSCREVDRIAVEGIKYNDIIIDFTNTRNARLSEEKGDSEISLIACQECLEVIKYFLSSGKYGNETRFFFVTKNSQMVVETDKLEGLWHAPIASMIKIFLLENPAWSVTHVDLDCALNIESVKHLLAINTDDVGHKFYASRDGVRYKEKLIKEAIDSNHQIYSDGIHVEGGVFLITGGLGGIGLELGLWLAKRRALRLILVSRRPPDNEGELLISKMRQCGALIDIEIVDVSDPEQVSALFEKVFKTVKILCGVFHAAGVLADATVMQQTRSSLKETFMPKANGAWNIHKALEVQKHQPRYFVLFSSAASLIGNQGQLNHAAANGFLDGLANYRRARSLPCQSINWGAWSAVGILRDEKRLEFVLSRGYEKILPADGFSTMSILVGKNASNVGVCPMRWGVFLDANGLIDWPYYSDLYDGDIRKSKHTKITLAVGTFPHEVERIVIQSLEQIIGEPIFQDEKSKNITAFGIDSLGMLDLRNKIQNYLEFSLPPALIVESRSLNDLINGIIDISKSKPNQQKKENIRGLVPQDMGEIEYSMQQYRWLSLIKKGYGRRIVPVIIDIEFDEKAFRKALFAVVNRHKLLRFTYPDNKIFSLSVEDTLAQCLSITDLRFFGYKSKKDWVNRFIEQSWTRMDDPARGISWKLSVVILEARKFCCLVSLQHIDFDGSSLATFTEELFLSYKNFKDGGQVFFDKTFQYDEYIASHHRYMDTDYQSDRKYFSEQLRAMSEITALPGHLGFNITVPAESRRYTPPIARGLWSHIRSFAMSSAVTPFSIMLAAYALLISNIIKKDGVCISLIVNGRSGDEFKRTIGPFTAPFPIYVEVGQINFLDIARTCNKNVQEVNLRCRYPVVDLISVCEPFRGLPMDTYFSDVGINFTNYKASAFEEMRILEPLGPIDDPIFKQISEKPLMRIPGLHLVIDNYEDEVRFNYWYQSNRFDEHAVGKWSKDFHDILVRGTGWE